MKRCMPSTVRVHTRKHAYNVHVYVTGCETAWSRGKIPVSCTKYTVNTERWDDHSDAHFARSFDNADDDSVVQGDHVEKPKTSLISPGPVIIM